MTEHSTRIIPGPIPSLTNSGRVDEDVHIQVVILDESPIITGEIFNPISELLQTQEKLAAITTERDQLKNELTDSEVATRFINATRESSRNTAIRGVKYNRLVSQTPFTRRKAIAFGGAAALTTLTLAGIATEAFGKTNLTTKSAKKPEENASIPLSTLTPTPTETIHKIDKSQQNEREQIIETLDIPFLVDNWNILFQEQTLKERLQSHPEIQELVLSINHYMDDSFKGEHPIKLDTPARLTLALSNNATVISFEGGAMRITTDAGEYISLPAINFDKTRIGTRITDQNGSIHTAEQEIPLPLPHLYPEKYRNGNNDGLEIRADTPIKLSTLGKINHLTEELNNLGIDIWRVILTDQDRDLYASVNNVTGRNIIIASAGQFDQDNPRHLTNPELISITAQAMDILTHPIKYQKYTVIEPFLAKLSNIYEDISPGLYNGANDTFLYDLTVSSILDIPTSMSMSLVPQWHGNARYLLREIIPMIKFHPEKVVAALNKFKNIHTHAQAATVLTGCLDVIRSSLPKSDDSFELFFPENKELFKMIGYK